MKCSTLSDFCRYSSSDFSKQNKLSIGALSKQLQFFHALDNAFFLQSVLILLHLVLPALVRMKNNSRIIRNFFDALLSISIVCRNDGFVEMLQLIISLVQFQTERLYTWRIGERKSFCPKSKNCVTSVTYFVQGFVALKSRLRMFDTILPASPKAHLNFPKKTIWSSSAHLWFVFFHTRHTF